MISMFDKIFFSGFTLHLLMSFFSLHAYLQSQQRYENLQLQNKMGREMWGFNMMFMYILLISSDL